MESGEMIGSAGSAAQYAMIVMDSDGKIAAWNNAAERMFGYTKKEVLGKDLHSLLAPKRYHDAAKKAFPHFQKEGDGALIGKTVESAAVRRDGTEFPIELSLSTFYQRGAWFAVGIVRDITEHKKMEAARKDEMHNMEILLDAAMGREEKMAELKEKINELEEKLKKGGVNA